MLNVAVQHEERMTNKEYYYEDFEVGQQFKTGTQHVDRDVAIAFARDYDPQLQHIDEEAAKNSVFGQLVISGWQTAAISMRLKLTTPLAKVANGLVGVGLESVKWPKPVLPNDVLYIIVTILEKRVSGSRPDKGIVKYKVETFNQRDEKVMEMTTSVFMPRRP